MNSRELKKKYLDFFRSKGHMQIPSASLIPENDPTVLFTTAGMHPLVPFLMGEKHPMGKRLVNVQKCLRTDDIEDIGDSFHNTFFEMLGNWSLGDYFKKDSIAWSHEFLTSRQWLGISPDKLYFTVFAGDADAKRDEESYNAWISAGVPEERIIFLPRKDNWWGPVGDTGPCGPDTEIFYDTGKKKCSEKCAPGCSCGKYFELWNNVFMEYNKTEKGYEKLAQRNVDTGMGVERTVAVLQGRTNIYETELFSPIMEKIREISKSSETVSERIVADHTRASVFVLGDPAGVTPSNVGQGYILRRLIRRAVRHGRHLGMGDFFLGELAVIIIEQYKDEYPELEKNRKFILSELEKEESRFMKTLENGLAYFEKIKPSKRIISGRDAFLLFQSYGFPIEITKELARERGMQVDEKAFEEEYRKHQELSRKSSGGSFKSGLQDTSEISVRYHTATHLLHQALRQVLGREVIQKGSNITPERMRFDFSYPRKMTDEQIREVECIVNSKIEEAIPVEREEMTPEEARKSGAIGLFDHKYGDSVSVYNIGDFSKEICSGPHVNNTSEIGKFRILKEESVAAGVRRIKAVLE